MVVGRAGRGRPGCDLGRDAAALIALAHGGRVVAGRCADDAVRRRHARQCAAAGGGPSFIDRSIARTCLVSPPIEMQSTPSSAIARSAGQVDAAGDFQRDRAVERRAPRCAPPRAGWRRRSRRSGCGRSLRASASSSCASVSTSTISGSAGCIARAARIAAVDRTRRAHVVFLQHHRVEQADAVVDAAADAHRVLLRLAKYAVRVGGGDNHRMGLYER